MPVKQKTKRMQEIENRLGMTLEEYLVEHFPCRPDEAARAWGIDLSTFYMWLPKLRFTTRVKTEVVRYDHLPSLKEV